MTSPCRTLTQTGVRDGHAAQQDMTTTFCRTIVTRIQGVSDPSNRGPGPVSREWQRGSLTPQMPSSLLLTGAPTTFGGPLDLANYKHEYREGLQRIIDAKIAGEEIVAAPVEAPPRVVNLMEALLSWGLTTTPNECSATTPVRIPNGIWSLMESCFPGPTERHELSLEPLEQCRRPESATAPPAESRQRGIDAS
jgi:hypothetical protein